jgi:uncharacterized protein (TIGR02266 family)
VKRHIVVVDDQNFWRQRLSMLVAEMGHEVTALDDGLAAIKTCMESDRPVDLAVVDLVMPGLDGFQVARYLRSQRETQDLPIVAVTGLFKEADFPDGPLVHGFDAVLDKASPPDEFAQVFSKFLHARRNSRRPAPRVRANIPVTFSRPGKPSAHGVILNISTSGAFVSTASPIAEGTELSLAFALPGGAAIRAIALVIWVSPGAASANGLPRGMGVLFRGLPTGWERALREFVGGELREV